MPAEIKSGKGSFELSGATTIQAPRTSGGAADAARYLSGLWQRTNGMTLAVRSSSTDASTDSFIRFQRQQGLGPEAYRIEVAPHRIIVSASTSAGLFYGAVTLWQLMPAGPKSGAIAAQTISDEPRYAWRGLMLDSSRHFQSPAFIRSMIDWMAWHKLNVLHWHLTDDQGWRLEIKRYPRLTSVGAWRIPATVPGTSAPKPYGGYYTQEEVRSIVAFAATRHVQIIPEIDMPGHAQAAVAAYPEVGSIDGHPSPPVSSKWGVNPYLFNLEPGTFEFLRNVLDEVLQLFPSRYVHIGGDEAVKEQWKSSASVQARAAQLGIKDAEALQTYFTQEISSYLTSKGRRAVGWDEIMQPGLARDTVVMSWHGTAGARAAAIRGNDTILAPDPGLYLDHRQSRLAGEPPGRLAVLSLKDVYDFEPRDTELTPAQQRHVLGLQAELWTEHMQTEKRVEWMALPRAAALAEVGWSSLPKNWPDFLRRMTPMFARYRAFNLNYADSVFGIEPDFAAEGDKVRVTLANLPELRDAALDADIRYTLDGTDANAASARYGKALDLSAGTEIRAATFLGTEQVSRTWSTQVTAVSAVRRSSNQLAPCGNAVGLLLEPSVGAARAPLAVDIVNPCWIYRGADLSQGPRISAAVVPLPFNYELGADAAHIRVGDARSPDGELEVHIDGCDTPAVALLPLAPAAMHDGVTVLTARSLPASAGRHDVCLRFARPRPDPMWALDWAQIGE
ncbi:MAG TPA: family 20 glycosylhydrolase [Steroidobacteraceae bacterium]|nr:family 20 glycosylhydrolase [Steroidobacteraceae bacterium]